MTLDHIALAVRSIEAAADQLTKLLGYARSTPVVMNTRQKVNVLFLSKSGSLDIKLIEPAGEDSPLWESLRRGAGLHHVAFRVDDVRKAVAELSAAGARVLAAPAPGEAFDDHLIAFCYAGSGLNIELVDTDVRRGRV